MKNKISIILPTYNGEKFISNAIQSILKQSYKNIELIIVNDCSKDNTLQIISEYASKDSRIKIIHNKHNLKLPHSLNIGFAEATGEYLTWTSDDNTYHPNALEKMALILTEHSNIDLVYTDFSIIDITGNLIKKVSENDPSEIRFHCNVGACFLYRSTLAEKVGKYDLNMFLAEDYDFFIRCYKNGMFFHLPEDLYNYTQHEASLTSTRTLDIAHQTFIVMNKHFDFLLAECHSQEERNRFFHTLLSLLPDIRERNQERKKFYHLDPHFAKNDFKLRFLHLIKLLFSSPHKLFSTIKSAIAVK